MKFLQKDTSTGISTRPTGFVRNHKPEYFGPGSGLIPSPLKSPLKRTEGCTLLGEAMIVITIGHLSIAIVYIVVRYDLCDSLHTIAIPS